MIEAMDRLHQVDLNCNRDTTFCISTYAEQVTMHR